MSTNREAKNESPRGSVATLPTTMKAAVARRYGTAEVVRVEEIPVPKPGSKAVLVRVRATSLNALDWHFLTGSPYVMRIVSGLRVPKRVVPGADVAGTVVAIGSDVTSVAIGDEVFGMSERRGGCASYMAISADDVIAKPRNVSFEAAGATPAAGLTAWQALVTQAATKPGDHVLINGAAGGVGTFAVQIAIAVGATVTAVCSGRNVEMVRALGATEVIDYTTTDFVPGGRRFDVMIDNVGNRSPAECISVLKNDARYVVTTGPKKNRWLGPIPKQIRLAMALWRADPSFHSFTASMNRTDLEALAELLAAGKIVPQMQRAVGLDGVEAGLAEIGTGHTRAKIGIHLA